MKATKMHDIIKRYKKDYVHNRYARIIKYFKDYDKITAPKMLDAIYKEYENYNNIISICTIKELKYLKMVLDKKTPEEKLLEEKYRWELVELQDKFLIVNNFLNEIFIPDEIIDNVREAIRNVNWDTAKKLDNLNEVLVSYCKIQGFSSLKNICFFGSSVTKISEEKILKHILNNKVFNFYVVICEDETKNATDEKYFGLYYDYYGIQDEIYEGKKKQRLTGTLPINQSKYKTFFYNDFDIDNDKIRTLFKEIKKLPFFWFISLGLIKEFSVLNLDRKELKETISSIPSLQNINLTNFFKVLDEAMDEMPSAVLNGLTPNEAKKLKLEEANHESNKNKKFVKQKNACLSKSEAELFYKIYFALLEFTNKKYKINPKIKIYKSKDVNPYEIQEIIKKFWENKVAIILEFCLANPYKFNSEELKIIGEFKKGFRDVFTIAKFYEEYTAVINKEQVYMIKGLYQNLDEVLHKRKLPISAVMAIMPFKDVIIYDGILGFTDLKITSRFENMVKNKLENNIKLYHL